MPPELKVNGVLKKRTVAAAGSAVQIVPEGKVTRIVLCVSSCDCPAPDAAAPDAENEKRALKIPEVECRGVV